MQAPEPKCVELHLGSNTDFTRYSKRVKSLGGKYSACRGIGANTRYVTLPWTPEGRELANLLFAKFGNGKKITVIARGVDKYNEQHVPAWVVVQHVEKSSSNPMQRMLELYQVAFEQAVNRSILKLGA